MRLVARQWHIARTCCARALAAFLFKVNARAPLLVRGIAVRRANGLRLTAVTGAESARLDREGGREIRGGVRKRKSVRSAVESRFGDDAPE
ncbi:hypothetical protein MTO96_039442 [Rhipicephalus appendiculatus]